MKLDSMYGSMKIDPSQAINLIKTWFQPSDIVVLSGKRVERISGENNVMSQCMTAQEMVQSLSAEDGYDILQELCISPRATDLYINVGSPRGVLSSAATRVREADLDNVIGVIGDFDVKEGSFNSTEDILTFLSSLEIQPTMIVSSGSGGVHAWWKFSQPESGVIPVAYGKELALRWWSHINLASQRNYGASIDKLVDTARMLRLPGTVHWPRHSLVGNLGAVELLSHTGPQTTPTRILEVSADAWGERLIRVSNTREKDKSLTIETTKFAEVLAGNKWQQLYAVANIEEFFNDKISWETVLGAAGWSYYRTDSAGRDEWSRPGREGEKSACVNWKDSPDVMSLLSTSHDTNLLDLLDADIPLTKWRVSLRLNFSDDYQMMVNRVMELMRE